MFRMALLVLALCAVMVGRSHAETATPAISGSAPELANLPPWRVPDVDKAPNDAFGRAARRGRDLMLHSTALMGPDAPDPAKRYSGNGLECTNCHLEAGTVRFGLPLVGIYRAYPSYSARDDRVQSLTDRVNDCMERSMNGRRLPPNSPEMQAILAYIRFLGEGYKTGQTPVGRGAPKLPLPTRAADPEKGAVVFREVCAACHRANGEGLELQLGSRLALKRRYVYPPLWGPESFNDAAGMARIITAAWFVHANMPSGIAFNYPMLAADDAYDVMAFVDTQPRPHKAGLENDYPDRWLKPVGTQFPPWIGPFSEQQNRFGPWQPILDWRKDNMPNGHHGPPAANDTEQSVQAQTGR